MPINPKFRCCFPQLEFKQPNTIEGLAKKIIKEKVVYVKDLIDYEINTIMTHSTWDNMELIEKAIAELEKIKNAMPCQ